MDDFSIDSAPINGSGIAEIKSHARADGRVYSQVPLDGVISIDADIVCNAAGRPAIPTFFMPAPDNRVMRVPNERRERSVRHTNRSL